MLPGMLRQLCAVAASCTVFILFLLHVQGCGSSRPEAVSADGLIANGGVFTGACEIDGAVAECHVETGRSGDVVNCFSGRQTCMQGVWSACGGGANSGGTMTSKSVTELEPQGRTGGGGLNLLTVSETAPSSDGGGCSTNPCNPYCNGIDVDADSLQPDGGFTSTQISGSIVDPSNFPAGVTGPKSAASDGIVATNSYFQCSPPGPQMATNFQNCSYDFCCATSGPSASTCVNSVVVGGANPTATACNRASGVDYTAGIGCTDAQGHLHVPVCNRGQTPAPTTGSLFLGFYAGNPNNYGTSDVCAAPGNSSENCTIDLSKVSLSPGTCIDIDTYVNGGYWTCNGTPTGNRTVMVNPGVKLGTSSSPKITSATAAGTTVTINFNADPGTNFNVGKSIAVSGFLPAAYNGGFKITAKTATSVSYVVSAAPGGAATTLGQVVGAALAEDNICNDYSFFQPPSQGGSCVAYGQQPPPPTPYTFKYKAWCPPSFRIVWNQLAYSTAVPLDSEVTFAVSTAPAQSDGGPGTFTTPVPVADVKSTSSPDPAYCGVNGAPDANVCPKNLTTALGDAAYNDILKVDVTLIAKTALPTVYGWQVSFNCVPYE